jgi:hypothetical protein
LATASGQFEFALSGANLTLATALDTSDSAYREAVSAAQSQYLVQLFTDHAGATSLAASSLLADPSADAARQLLSAALDARSTPALREALLTRK